jgi:hypothetical protein
MKKVVLTICIFLACATMIAVNSCCKKTTTTNTDKCSFNTKTLDYEWVFKDTGNIDGTLLAFANLVPPGTNVDSVSGSNIANTVPADLANKNIDTCQVKQIVAQNLRVAIDSPASYNFDMVDSIWVYISEKTGANKKVIATKGGIAPGTKQIIMNLVPNFNLQPYLIQDSFAFRLGARRGTTAVNYNAGPMFLNFEAKFVGTVFTE